MEYHHGRNLEPRAQELRRILEERDSENSALKERIQAMEQQTVQLMRDVARLCNEHPDAQRDDFYYERAIANIGRAIQRWAMQNYYIQNPNSKVVEALSGCKEIQDVLIKRLGDNWLTALSSKTVECVQIYLMHKICEQIFEPFLLDLGDDGYLHFMNLITPNLTKDECVQWRILTVKSLAEEETAWSKQAAQNACGIRCLESLMPHSGKIESTYSPSATNKALLPSTVVING
ncbi:hypothetical protein BDZ91DRAFT_846651 [Kalaharituber pfeilii]|nr:hypothetical protein BDZ91DRAFT_846651 [Kalaharituber pfeilii]